LRKWILKVILFFVFFAIVSIVVFELSFRFSTADFFIRLLDEVGFLGFKTSFDSLVILLVVFSFFISLFVFSVLIARKKGNK